VPYILQTKNHLRTRFPLGLLLIVLWAVLPFIMGFSGSYLTENFLHKSCHEGNCIWGALPWLGIFVTLPLGIIFLIIYLVISIVDILQLFGKDK